MNEPKIKTVHWSEILYNPYRKGVFPELLRHGIYEMTFYARIKGMKKTDDEIKVKVIFDEEYLVNFIIKKIFIPLQIHNHSDDFNKLMKVLGIANKEFKKQLRNEAKND